MMGDVPVSVAKTTAMTVSILRELFQNCAACCETLHTDADFADRLRMELSKMPPLQIGKDGRLLEWCEELQEQDAAHRHVSHLYGLYPGNEISIRRTPELADACRRSLMCRTDGGTGWSLAWKINLWARLGEGDHALALLKRQMRLVKTTDLACRHSGGGTYLNLFDAHPPFQIDGNFGACAGIAQMLLQNDGDELILLPALPQEWESGSVCGLCAKYGICVSMEWNDHALARAVLSAPRDMEQVVCYKDQAYSLSLKGGQAYTMIFEKRRGRTV